MTTAWLDQDHPSVVHRCISHVFVVVRIPSSANEPESDPIIETVRASTKMYRGLL